MLLFLTVQWVFGPLAAPLGSATHDVLLNIVEVAADHATNLDSATHDVLLNIVEVAVDHITNLLGSKWPLIISQISLGNRDLDRMAVRACKPLLRTRPVAT